MLLFSFPKTSPSFPDTTKERYDHGLYDVIGNSAANKSHGFVVAISPDGRVGFVCADDDGGGPFGQHERDAACREMGYLRTADEEEGSLPYGTPYDLRQLSAVVGGVECGAGQDWKDCRKQHGERYLSCFNYAGVVCTSETC